MKVKVLTANIMVDYKKVEKGQVIDLPKDTAERFIKAGLVDSTKDDVSQLIVTVDGEEINLAGKSGKYLTEFAKQYELEAQRPGEKVGEFAERLKAEYEAMQMVNKCLNL